MNPITQAMAAAHALAARAAAGGRLTQAARQDVLWKVTADEPLPMIDPALAELSGEELLVLAFAAEALAQRARVTEINRRIAADEARAVQSKED